MAKKDPKDEVVPVNSGGLVEYDDAALAKYDANVGMEDVHQDDVQFPTIRIHQGTSTDTPDDSRPGDFYSKGVGLVENPLTVVPIALFYTRVMWGANIEDPPLCMSANGQVPTTGESPPDEDGHTHGLCKLCPFAVMRRNPQGKPMPSPCSEVANFVVLARSSAGGSYPGLLRLSRTSRKAAREIVSAWKFTVPQRPIWSKAYQLTTTKKTFEKGAAFVPSARVVGASTEEERAAAQSLLADWTRLREKAQAEAMSELERDEEGSPHGGSDTSRMEGDQDIPF